MRPRVTYPDTIWDAPPEGRAAVCFCGIVYLPRPWHISTIGNKPQPLCNDCGYTPFEQHNAPAHNIGLHKAIDGLIKRWGTAAGTTISEPQPNPVARPR